MISLYCALVHYPVRDRAGNTVTASLTNLDVHDISRLAFTYGLRGYFVITPLMAQQTLAKRILDYWKTGAGKHRMPERSLALGLCRPLSSLERAIEQIQLETGKPPRVLATAARPPQVSAISSFQAEAMRLQQSEDPVLILFGTSHGLDRSILDRADAILEPIRGHRGYNHLSVRCAAAITLDRLVGSN